jgi:hypothetical protein
MDAAVSRRDMLLEAQRCIGMAYKTRRARWLTAARYWIASAQCARLLVQP